MNFAINPWERLVCMCVCAYVWECVAGTCTVLATKQTKCKNEIQEQQQVESSRVEPSRVDSLSSI